MFCEPCNGIRTSTSHRSPTSYELGAVSLQTMYDVLAALTSAKLVRRVRPPGTPTLFELGYGDAHQHAMCCTCGIVMDLSAPGSSRLSELPAAPGFVVEEVEVTLHGLCQECAPQSDTNQSAH
ncbi:Fur family transcriptional regulator [Streptomyces sp. NPDC059629]|uniref:Fur family transcriptional regulator n=1 Tax=Streptomyces sp. NPDC059629 TaxID=3346889 RepID=UPI0036B5AD0C